MAKKFKFKLDALLKLREFKEKKLKVELGNLVSGMNRAKELINDYGLHINEAYAGQEKLLEGQVQGEMLKFFPYFVEGKNAAIKKAKENLATLQTQYEAKIKEMTIARGETKVIDKLKDKEHLLFKKEKAKKDFEKIEDLRIITQGNGK